MSCISAFLSITYITISSALDLGHGGVYDSPAAQKYWEERFGDLESARQTQDQDEIFQVTQSLMTEKETLDETFAESEEKLLTTTAIPSLLTSAESLQPSSSASLLAVQSSVSPYSLFYFPLKIQPLY